MASSTMKSTTVRFDEGLKTEAMGILDSIGLGLNAYLTLALRQLVNQRRVPFDLVATPDVPNDATQRAMLVAEAKEAGLVEDDSLAFDNVSDFLKSLDS